jgi:hypothetical protein
VRHQNRHGNLLAVAAGSKRNAWAVGNVQGKGHFGAARTLTLHWNGKKWKRVGSPSPAAHTSLDVLLDAVSIISRRNVWAVGDISCACGPGTPVIEHWNGKKWKVVHHPKSNTGGNLFGVAGVAAHHVWIAGAAGEGTSPEKTLVLTWNGHKWKHERAPSPVGSSDLRGIVVTSAHDAWAVGGASNKAQTHTAALIERWNGRRWRVVRQSSATAPAALHASRSHALWFQTADGFFLRTGAGHSIPLTNTFSRPVLSAKTHDFAYLTFGAHSATATTLSATGKLLDHFKCGCGGVLWLGRNLVGINKRTLLFRNVSGHTTRRVKLDGARYMTGSFDTLPAPVAALGRHTMLVTAVTPFPSSSGGPEVFFRVTKSGHVTKLASAPNNTVINSGVTNRHDFAYVSMESAGVCADFGGVSVLDTSSGKLTNLRLPKLNRPWIVTSLRYAGRKLLVGLAKSPKPCASGNFTSPRTGHATAHIYKRSGRRLVRTSLAVADRQRDGKQTATASGPRISNSLAGFASRSLAVTQTENRSVLARKVFAFSWL